MCPRVEYAKRLGLPNLLNTTCCPCKREGNIFVLSFCLRWLRGRWQQFLLGATGYFILQLPKGAVRVRTENFQGPRHQQHPFLFPLHVTNNCRCFRVPPSKSEPYRHSFFVRIIIIDWNHLEYAVWTLRRVKRCVNAKRPTVSPAHSGRESAGGLAPARPLR